MAENPYAGQGPVLLDIGGDVGAVLVEMPPELSGLEVEIRPLGRTARPDGADGAAGQMPDRSVQQDRAHVHGHDHPHEHGHDHSHEHGHDHPHDREHGHPHEHEEVQQPAGTGRAAYPHVAVVPRPGPRGLVHSLVYAEVAAGEYELYPLPAGPVAMTVTAVGGQVTTATWPGTAG